MTRSIVASSGGCCCSCSLRQQQRDCSCSLRLSDSYGGGPCCGVYQNGSDICRTKPWKGLSLDSSRDCQLDDLPTQTVIKNGEMLGVSHLRNRRVLSNGFVSLGKEELQLMYNDGDKAFGTSTDLCIDERLRIASDGIIVVSMEILRPQNLSGTSQTSLKGKIRITTRCLWLDKGKLLDALYKAAHAALSSCPVNCPLPHMERIVSEVMRKMVRKYSSKRPEVIAIAMENTTGARAEELKMRLSGTSHGISGLSTTDQPSHIYVRRSGRNKFDKFIDEDNLEDSPDLSQTMLEDDPDLELSSSDASTNVENLENSFQGPSIVQLPEIDNNTVAERNLEVSENGTLSNEEEDKSSNTETVPVKPVKRNKWRPDEIDRLIKKRSELDSRFQAVKGRMVLWEEISASLLSHGITRSPAQCKSLWASLVQKYKECKIDENCKKIWPYFDSMDEIFSAQATTK